MSMSSPLPADDAFAVALNFYRKGNLTDAHKACQTKLSREPRHAQTLHLAGLISIRQQKAKEAIKLFKKAIKSDPNSAQYHASLAEALAATGSFPRARSAFRRAVTLQPENINFLYGLATVHIHMRAYADAAEVLSRAIDRAPGEGGLYVQLGVALQEENPHGAIEAYEKAIELGADAPMVYFNLSTALAKISDYNRAITALKEVIKKDPENQRSYRNLGNIYLTCSDFQEAAEALRRAIELNPQDGSALVDLGSALLGTGDTDEAVAIYEQIVEQNLAPPLQSASNLALAYLAAGRPEDALRQSETGLEIVGNDTACLGFKATALNHLERREEAAFLLDFDRFLYRKQFKAVEGYETVDDFNSQFTEHIINRPEFGPSKLNRGLNSGESMPAVFFEGPLSPVEETFHAMIQTAIQEYREALPLDASHPFLTRHPEKTRIHWWGNLTKTHGSIDPHFHPIGWLSGVYYSLLPEAIDLHGESQEGWIEFGREYAKIGSNDTPPVVTIKPETGLMLLFPSYFGHRTLPFSTADERMSIAFDVIPVK